jgi:hypothetical protein
VHAEIALRPRDAADDASLLNLHAWQGGGLVVSELRETAPGTYRTTRPVPAGGNWKTVVQLERDRAVLALPIHMPADTGIPAPAIPAEPRFTRAFAPGSEVFLREQRDDVPAGLAGAGYAVMLALWVAMLAATVMALVRLVRGAADRSRQPLHRSV